MANLSVETLMLKEWKLRHLPEVYKTEKRLHNDWPWPFSKIPRWVTFWPLPFPPRKWAGAQEENWIEVQEGYPLAPDVTMKINTLTGRREVLSIHPVGWGWSIQSVWIAKIGRVPCYFQLTKMLFGRKFHFNIGCRPDVTLNDFGGWSPEMSLAWTKVNK